MQDYVISGTYENRYLHFSLKICNPNIISGTIKIVGDPTKSRTKMLPRNKTDNARILRNCIHYLAHVDIYGGEAIEVAECLQFLKSWLKLSGATKKEMERFKNEFERRKKK